MLPHQITGNTKSDILLVFLHGWPDTLELWEEIIKPFEISHLILNISYPNYSEKEKIPIGNDLKQIVDKLKYTIEENNKEKRKIILVCHDWGAIIGYLFDSKYPKTIDSMLAIDVSPKMKINSLIIEYQIDLIFAFMVGGQFGDELTHLVIESNHYNPPYKNKINSSWNYHYYYYWRDLKEIINIFRKYRPSCPIAFLYGTKKPFMFHTDSWLNFLKSDSKNEVLGVQSSHWVMRDQPGIVISMIKRRIDGLIMKPKF